MLLPPTDSEKSKPPFAVVILISLKTSGVHTIMKEKLWVKRENKKKKCFVLASILLQNPGLPVLREIWVRIQVSEYQILKSLQLKNSLLEIKNCYSACLLFIQLYYCKDFGATGKASSPLKKTSSTTQHSISSVFFFYVSLLPAIEPTESVSNPDPEHW
jgi:hypothetical protein